MTLDHLGQLVDKGSILDVLVVSTDDGFSVVVETLNKRETIETVRGLQRTWKTMDTLCENLSERGIKEWRFEDRCAAL
jgi:hypothetical protein